MNVKWEDVKEDFARKDAEIESLKVMNSKLENSLECVLNAVEAKKPAVQYDPLVAMNTELVKALDHTNQVLYNTIKLWNSSKSNKNDPLDYELCNENQILIHKAKELSHEEV